MTIMSEYMEKAGEVAAKFVDMNYVQENPVVGVVYRELFSFSVCASQVSERYQERLSLGVSFIILCGFMGLLRSIDAVQPQIDAYNELLDKYKTALAAQETGNFKVDYRGTIDEAVASSRENMSKMEV